MFRLTGLAEGTHKHMHNRERHENSPDNANSQKRQWLQKFPPLASTSHVVLLLI